MKLNKDFWNNRYIDKEIGWDLGEIAPPLKEYFNQLKNKELKIIIPGCGNAYEAEYLFNRGFKNVFLIDLSPTALEQFATRVPNFPKNQLICGDFFNHNEEYDLMIEQTFFCAINPSLRSDYAKHTAKILKSNGKLVGLLFNDDLNADHPPFGGNREEYLNCFSPYFNIEIMETAHNSIEPRNDRELFIKLSKK
ncbi:MAG: methyltransferase domain-containing protein [Flavobacteriales bacterium]|nr:methyltransferase domain-containing protein [Flavobacteriales bacterium]